LLPLQNGIQSGAERESRLAGSRPPAEGHDAEFRVEQEVDGETLLGRTPMEAEDVAVATHQPQLAPAGDPTERGTSIGMDDQPGVDRQVAHGTRAGLLVLVERRDLLRPEVDLC